ncbi:MAG TPA: ammonia-forming cytochrome c nitrite reductase subunit c552 [bacterium]|jgi:nitrite reductase (cytochrome c-552)
MRTSLRNTVVLIGSVVLTIIIAALLVNIFQHKQEARLTYVHVTQVQPGDPNSDNWGPNFPREYDLYKRTMTTTTFTEYSKYGRYGGSENYSRLDKYPNLRRMFAGYPFSVQYTEERGHMHALEDMLASQRLGDKKPGPCITCKSPQVPQFIEKYGAERLYHTPVKTLVDSAGFKFTIGCADCHNAETMALTVRRPAFIEAMAKRGIDVKNATHSEMRIYVCAQCHVEYYWPKETLYLTFPWAKGTVVDSIEAYYDSLHFKDWIHGETGAPMIKMQHPEFEIFTSGIHYRAGVSCPDCHMPYIREGATKITDHWIRTPLAHIQTSCQTCHRESEEELRSRVFQIQDRTFSELKRAENAIIAAMDGIKAAMAMGATDAELDVPRALHRRAQMRWDFVNAENSMGFHSGQETARVLGDATDFGRQAELAAFRVLIAHGGSAVPPPQPQGTPIPSTTPTRH